ncbi:unnamed protein product [Rangifer tarandus platyrhynchus]|uniref:Uncharacterized protein n=2 Tax=Rangifer tarandus platyrhynchus TaxID=3082113 RepID=A0ABN8ZPF6_RANTA|nr:unnamed protein product [Rangifer tarandus platyrhynchus]
MILVGARDPRGKQGRNWIKLGGCSRLGGLRADPTVQYGAALGSVEGCPLRLLFPSVLPVTLFGGKCSLGEEGQDWSFLNSGCRGPGSLELMQKNQGLASRGKKQNETSPDSISLNFLNQERKTRIGP